MLFVREQYSIGFEFLYKLKELMMILFMKFKDKRRMFIQRFELQDKFREIGYFIIGNKFLFFLLEGDLFIFLENNLLL